MHFIYLPSSRRRNELEVDGGKALACALRLLGATVWLGAAVVLTPARGVAGADEAGEAGFLTNIRQLTLEGRRSGEGYFSADGKAMVFQSERDADNPFYQIYLLDLESGDINRVSPGMGKTTCSFLRPGSGDVLFASSHLDPEAKVKQKAELDARASGQQRRYAWDYDDQMDIFVAKRDGSSVRRLTDAPGYDAEGSFSPDGKLIAFCSLRDAYPKEKLSAEDRKRLETDPSWFGEIYLMNADGSNQHRLTKWPGYDGGPFFSPDGQRIVWRHFEENGAIADVYTMNLEGADVRRVTDFGSMSWAPYFHPSARYIIFASNKLGFSNFELYLVDAEGTREPVRVTFRDGFDGLPVFSPDGRRLAWTSGRTSDGKSQIFLADWNHQAALDALKSAPARQTNSARSAAAVPAQGGRAATVAGTSSASSAPAANSVITTNDLHDIVAHLASEELAGRAAGSPEGARAGEYIAGRMRRLGLVPAGTNSGFFQAYDFNAQARVVTNACHLRLAAGGEAPKEFTVEHDFRPLGFSANAEVTGPVVFAGYGLSLPGKAGEGYDSYEGLDVSNKVVLVLRYTPEEVDSKRRAELNMYAGARFKAMAARNHGAKAVLIATGPTSPNAGELIGFSSDTTPSDSGIAVMSVSSNVVAALFAGSGRDLKTLQAGLDKENPHAERALLLTNLEVRLTTVVEHIRRPDRNVIGVLPPAVGQGTTGPSEYVMAGAHYDHLGHGEAGGMNRKGEEGLIHPGADDNASGVATILELAEVCVAERARNPAALPRGIIFAAWSGEEIGLIGSTWFAEHPPLPLTNVVAYLNFDMVGRLRENKLILQGLGSSPAWTRLVEKRNVAAGFSLTLQDDPYLPTDTTAIYPKGVPVIQFFTGGHDDYHRPTDKAETLNYEGLRRVAVFAQGILMDLSKTERPAYAQYARKDAGIGNRESLRAYLGTIPDYATEVQGVKLSGVRAGGPADKAGLRGGDVLVEFGGTKIANIYDYTYAMDAAKIGQAVKVVVLRNGERVGLTVTPEARK